APPGTGLGALLSSVPMNGLTNWVRFCVAACASGATATVMAAAVASRPAARRTRRMGELRWGTIGSAGDERGGHPFVACVPGLVMYQRGRADQTGVRPEPGGRQVDTGEERKHRMVGERPAQRLHQKFPRLCHATADDHAADVTGRRG